MTHITDTSTLILTKEKPLYSDENLFYLGKWSLNYSVDLKKIRHDETCVLPYPFENSETRAEARLYLNEVDKHIFSQLCQHLNTYHGIQASYRYWRIIIGYWWKEFLEIIYTRYICIKKATDKLPHAHVKLFSHNDFITPYDAADFAALYKTDNYNHQMFSQIILYLNAFNHTMLTTHEILSINFHEKPLLNNNWRNTIKQLLSLFSRGNRYYLTSTYLKNSFLFNLVLCLKCIPLFIDTPRFLPSKNRNVHLYERCFFSTFNTRDEFESLLLHMLPMHFPKLYLEDFSKLERHVKHNFPSRAQQCIMAGIIAHNEGFKLFTANQTEKYQTPLVILQHGGHYGSSAWHSYEDFEKEISDHFLTYGWEEEGNPKVIPFIVNRFNESNDQPVGNSKGDILFVMTSSIRYPSMLSALPEGPLFIDYLNDQISFISSLTPAIRQILKVRPYQHTYGWHDLSYIERQTGALHYSNIKQPLSKEAKQSRLVISPYNGTSLLETLSLNIPTIIYFNPLQWPLRDSAKPVYEQLHKAGILYYDAHKAADAVSDIYHDTLKWWQQSHIQTARNTFCQQFAATSPHYSKKWLSMIRKLRKS